MKGLITKHFEDEGCLLYLDINNKLQNFSIKRNKNTFYNYLEQNKIDMPNPEPFYFTHKIKILNEFIDILTTNSAISSREFFKYLQRIQKFFFKTAQNDIFLISTDKNKFDKAKYQRLLMQEYDFSAKYSEIIDSFKQTQIKTQSPHIAEKYYTTTLANLKLFQEFSLELLKRPVLRGFKN